MADFFPTGSLIRRISAEPALFFGAGRALILQLAHPAVAQGVADHSDFKANPFKRLQGTLEGTISMVYGSDELAHGVGRRIQWIHDHVVGPDYRANDPENLLWVHATLYDTAVRCYTDFVGPLSARARETYYEEMCRVAEMFGLARSDMPATVADFDGYFAAEVERIEVTDVGRDLAAFIVDPELPLKLHVPMRPALSWHRVQTIGTTPEPIREQMGFVFDDAMRARYERFRRVASRLMSTMPYGLRTSGSRITTAVLIQQAKRSVAKFEARLADQPPPSEGAVAS